MARANRRRRVDGIRLDSPPPALQLVEKIELPASVEVALELPCRGERAVLNVGDALPGQRRLADVRPPGHSLLRELPSHLPQVRPEPSADVISPLPTSAPTPNDGHSS
jgi:hypothetical protein